MSRGREEDGRRRKEKEEEEEQTDKIREPLTEVRELPIHPTWPHPPPHATAHPSGFKTVTPSCRVNKPRQDDEEHSDAEEPCDAVRVTDEVVEAQAPVEETAEIDQCR